MNYRIRNLETFACLTCLIAFLPSVWAEDADRAANTIILDEIAVANLGIETVEVVETDFETTVFAIGRIEEIPESHSVLSSRIPGRVIELNAFVGDEVKKGQVLAVVESRQPGNPPPSIELKAPRDGLVIASHVTLGEPVEPDRDLLDIAERSKLWAVARIPEQEAAAIAKGTKARIRVPAIGQEAITAKLLRFGVEADREAGTLEGIFVVPNPEGKLVPGMRAEFSIITKSRDWVMAVPRTAIQGDPTKRVVFVKDFELPNAFLRAPVQLGEENEEYVEIITGLFPGDEVVTRGSYALSFAGGGSGMSLKEALDAAHGHEHAEDGTDLTPEQVAEKERQEAAAKGLSTGNSNGIGGSISLALKIYSGAVTLLLAFTMQMLWRSRRQPSAQPAS